ncbi:tRNA dihydrouridine synthase [Paenibacillus chungangensis]|uniref:tRNA-dihydrouridine synthase n=1 Tax=Paenibacillus chungangensis TaxID=696535 RepID=A0ABW3HVL7_9BACL
MELKLIENFWEELPKPFFVLAPMEDVTNVVFRHVVSKAGRPDVFFTEFTSTEGYCNPDAIYSERGRLYFTEDEQPMVAHIWGNNPDYYREMSIGLAKLAFKGIDINMGCPAHNIAAKAKGSGLILQPKLAADIIQATKAGGLPVSVKTRLGYSHVDEWREWLSHILRQDIANLSIHLRTKKEMSKVAAHWELIPEIKQLRDQIAPQTLLTINGDIADRKTGLMLAKQYGIDGVMIGRGIFKDPFAFEKTPREHSRDEKIELLNYHIDLYDKYATELEPRPFVHLLRFFKIYMNGFDKADELKNELMQTKSTDEVRQVLRNFTMVEMSVLNEKS